MQTNVIIFIRGRYRKKVKIKTDNVKERTIRKLNREIILQIKKKYERIGNSVP